MPHIRDSVSSTNGGVPSHIRTAILIIIEGHETAFNGFEYQFYYWEAIEKSETDPQSLVF
jgi:hypothetical protein